MAKPLPPLNGLRAFEAVARHLSFTKAADELSVTPAAISHQVRGLEGYLDVQLFHRQPRAISLTDAGRLLYPGLHAGFEQFHQALTRLERVRDDRVLVVSVGPAFTAKWLAPRLYRFLMRHPSIDARISANLSHSNFSTDGVDLAIRFGAGDYPDMFVERLMEDAVQPLCAPSLVAQHGLERPSDLANVPLIHDDSMTFSRGAPAWEHWIAAAGLDAVDPSRGLRFNLADHALNAAIEGAGVVLGRLVMAEADIAAGRLVAPFPRALPVTGLAFYLVCPPGTEERASVKAFREWIRGEIESTAAFIGAGQTLSADAEGQHVAPATEGPVGPS